VLDVIVLLRPRKDDASVLVLLSIERRSTGNARAAFGGRLEHPSSLFREIDDV
jgi:hypothetical protein